MVNEFEDMEDAVPAQSFSNEDDSSDEGLISSGNSGKVYDWNSAPEGVKAPPRIDLNGKVVTINKADIILPSTETEWRKNLAKTVNMKDCKFALHYDIGGQQEYYSGVVVFEKDGGKYSHPTIARDRKTQASCLLGAYADFKKKDINEISLKEFMAFLNQKPKGEIKSMEFKNPKTGAVVKKNIVAKFV